MKITIVVDANPIISALIGGVSKEEDKWGQVFEFHFYDKLRLL